MPHKFYYTAVMLFLMPALYAQQVAVKIGKLLPDPKGMDLGVETVTLVNNGVQSVDISGWQLKNKYQYKSVAMQGFIPAKSSITFVINSGTKYAFLNNNGDKISLLDSDGIHQDEVSYLKNQVIQGNDIVFFALKEADERKQINYFDTFSIEVPNWAWGVLIGAIIITVVIRFLMQRRRRIEADLEKQRELTEKAESELAKWVESNPKQLELLILQIEQLSKWGGYPRRRVYKELSDRISSSGVMGVNLNHLKDSNPLKGQVKRIQNYPSHHEVDRKQLKSKYIENELKVTSEFFDKVEKLPLTEMQRLAVVVNEENNLIVAGAGSGKTSVIAARVLYLIQRGLAKPQDILVLAFNRDAATELKQRIHSRTGPDVSIKTFHKLGVDIISESRGEKPSVATGEEDDLGKKLNIQRLLDVACEDKAFNKRLLNYFSRYLVPYQDITSFKEKAEYLEYLAKYELRSLKGEKSKEPWGTPYSELSLFKRYRLSV